MDFDVSVFIITSDRQYIPAAEYDNRLDGEGVFVMLTNDEMNTEFGDDNSICIYRDWEQEVVRSRERLKECIKHRDKPGVVVHMWQTKDEDIPNTFKLNEDTDNIGIYETPGRLECIRKYLDGQRTNREIMSNVFPLLGDMSVGEYIPAIMVAHGTNVAYDGRNVHGYLPVIGQLLFICKNIEKINSALSGIDSRVKLFRVDGTECMMSDYWWSATEYCHDTAWFLNHGSVGYGNKSNALHVLPLFVL